MSKRVLIIISSLVVGTVFGAWYFLDYLNEAVHCRNGPKIASAEQAMEKGVPLAIATFRELFELQSIDTRTTLLEKYPSCCTAYHPNIYPPPEGHEYYWEVSVKVKSPRGGGDEEIIVTLNSCFVGARSVLPYKDKCWSPPIRS